MLTVVLFAAAIAAGAHPAAMAIAGLAIVEPRLVVVGIAAWGIYNLLRRKRTADADSEAAFLRALAAELRTGTSLRLALADAALRVPIGLEHAGRLARAGRPMERIAPLVERALVHNGVTTAAALELSAWSGASAASIFEGLAERATEAGELRREQRAATTQARLSAWVVGLAPLAFTVLILAGGGFGSLAGAGSLGYAVIAAGITLELIGLLMVTLILRRAAR